jgi:hypothetical protein
MQKPLPCRRQFFLHSLVCGRRLPAFSFLRVVQEYQKCLEQLQVKTLLELLCGINLIFSKNFVGEVQIAKIPNLDASFSKTKFLGNELGNC